MNKILIVGHKNSHYQRLEEILQLCGMAKADVSHSHQMTPQQISQKILVASKHVASTVASNTKVIVHHKHNRHKHNKAKIVPKLNNNTIIGTYAQKKPRKIWDNLAFDLVLANSDKHLWGWSDSQAVELLEYWAEFDEDMAFILTYDRPHFLLEQLIKSISDDELSDKLFDEQLNDWLAYNQTLLDFYRKYPERCILVNGEQVIRSAPSYIDSVAKKIAWQPDAVDDGRLQVLAGNQNATSEVVKFFVDKLLSGKANAMAMLDALQELANIPWIYTPSTMTDLDLLKSMLKEKNELDTTKGMVVANQSAYLQKEKEWQQQFDKVKQAHQKDKQSFDETNKKLQDVNQENELLITQLHQVQEELERYYLENQCLKSGQDKSSQPAKPIYYGAADRVKQDLPYRLGATMVSHSKSTKDLAKLPFALAQEYRAFQKQQGEQGELPPVEAYQDSYEAEKVKKHLSYRLGKTLVDSMKSPKDVLALPAKLGREVVGFKKK